MPDFGSMVTKPNAARMASPKISAAEEATTAVASISGGANPDPSTVWDVTSGFGSQTATARRSAAMISPRASPGSAPNTMLMREIRTPLGTRR